MFLASLEGRGVDVDTAVNSRLHLFVTNFVTCSGNSNGIGMFQNDIQAIASYLRDDMCDVV